MLRVEASTAFTHGLDYEMTHFVAIAVVVTAVTIAAIVGLMIATSIGKDVTSLRNAYESALTTEAVRAAELELVNQRLR